MQKRALIFHGTMGSPDGNWFPWLKAKLEEKNYHVTVPTFPTPENHSLKSWITALRDQVADLCTVDLIIGHSLGANFILHVLEQNLSAPEQIILVSALNDFIDNKEYDALNKSFFKDFNWRAIQSGMKKADILHGDDDPYVPLNQAQDIADGLGLDLKVIQDGGHLNIETGYDRFPLLLELIDD